MSFVQTNCTVLDGLRRWEKMVDKQNGVTGLSGYNISLDKFVFVVYFYNIPTIFYYPYI